MPKIMIGNFVNQLMTSIPGPAHVRALTAPSSRKIWYADEGDIIVLPNKPDEEFIHYACRILGIDRSTVKVITPKGDLDEYLAVRVRRDSAALADLLQYREDNPQLSAEVFAQDAVTIDLLRDIDVGIIHYDALPSKATQAIVSKINTKSGFKDFAAGIGMRFVPGHEVRGVSAVLKTAREMLSSTGPVLIKIDRGSNGYGHHIVRNENELSSTEEKLLLVYEQPRDFIVEPLLDFTSLPSVEFLLTNSGATYKYTCDMRCINNAWTGMITPPSTLDSRIVTELVQWGQSAAKYLYERGYRGPFDIDCGVTKDGVLYATESNCRKTGGTYIDMLLRRLLGGRLDNVTWLADGKFVRSNKKFSEAVNDLEANGMAWRPDTGRGVLFTSNTTEIDGKWRYVIVGDDDQDVQAQELRLLRRLEGAQ